MITILATFCLLTVSYVDCVRKVNRDYHQEIEHWWLKDAWVSYEMTGQQTEHYTGLIQLTRYNDAFCIDTLEAGRTLATNILCFEMTEFYAVLDDSIYVITTNARRVVRMTLAYENQLKDFEWFFAEPEILNHEFVMKNKYDVVRIVESDEALNFKRIATSDVPETPVSVIELARLDNTGHDAGRRRFIISGGTNHEFYVAFNDGDYNFIRNGTTNRFVLEVRPPAGFRGKMYFGVMMTCRDDTPKNFAEDMARYASSRIAVPEILISLANNL